MIAMMATPTAPPVDRIEPRVLAERMARGQPVVILDVRRSDRWNDDHRSCALRGP